MRILAAASLLLFSFAAICLAQAAPQIILTSSLEHRIEVIVRDKYSLSPNFAVTIGTPSPSQFNDYEKLPITISYQDKSQTVNFLLSNDGARLVQMQTFNLTTDPVFHIGTAGRPIRGNPNAKVTIVNFDDLECPFCAELYKELFPATFARYGNQVRFVYMDSPLPQHPWAMHAAVDAGCLAAQNGVAYWDYVDYMHRHFEEISAKAGDLKMSFAQLDQVAREEGTVNRLNGSQLDACIAKQDQSAVKASMAEAASLGINQVPTFYVNGERVDGALPENQIWSVLDRALRAEGLTPPASQTPNAQAPNQQIPNSSNTQAPAQ